MRFCKPGCAIEQQRQVSHVAFEAADAARTSVLVRIGISLPSTRTVLVLGKTVPSEVLGRSKPIWSRGALELSKQRVC